MKVFVPMIVALGVVLGFQLYGDEVEIPESYLAVEEKACLRQAEQTTSQELAYAYCGCITDTIRATYRFKAYILKNASMSLQAKREDVSVTEVAGRDPELRRIHQSCFHKVAEELQGR